MNMKKLITIGLPVYNGFPLIKEALDSLLSQSYKNFELIISDNNSTDDTGSICSAYAAADSRIRYKRHSGNRGGFANFKWVLDEARGSYFMWACHDDLWSEGYLADMVSILDDESINYVFPKFRLESIRYKIGKLWDMQIFEFITKIDSKNRVLSFMELHPSSFKCNVVYSLFRTSFLRDVFHEMKGIPNDGLLGAMIVFKGCGIISNNSLFTKRYLNLWPGALDYLYRFLGKKEPLNFELFKKNGEPEAIKLFPSLESEIIDINNRFQAFKYDENYKV
jgi:glycosyltransferase involved in cell wall biosynthesis